MGIDTEWNNLELNMDLNKGTDQNNETTKKSFAVERDDDTDI